MHTFASGSIVELVVYTHTRFIVGVFSQYGSGLHFVDNKDQIDEASHPNLKLRKLWPVIEKLNDKFLTVCIPKQGIAVDERPLLYEGRLGWKQQMPLKRARFRLKFFLLCESSNGYVCNMILYTGKGTLLNDNRLAMGTKVVLHLMELYLNKRYTQNVGNYYNSPEVVDILIKEKTDIYGTVCPMQICLL